VAEGPPGPIVQQYRQRQRENQLAQTIQKVTTSGEQAIISHIDLLDEESRPQKEFAPLTPLTIRVHYHFLAPIANPVGKIRIRRADGLICMELRANDIPLAESGYFQACLQPVQLMPDFYTVEASIVDQHKPIVYVLHTGETFTVPGQLSDNDRAGVFQPQVTWEMGASHRQNEPISPPDLL
jgi:hypothetical protein